MTTTPTTGITTATNRKQLAFAVYYAERDGREIDQRELRAQCVYLGISRDDFASALDKIRQRAQALANLSRGPQLRAEADAAFEAIRAEVTPRILELKKQVETLVAEINSLEDKYSEADWQRRCSYRQAGDLEIEARRTIAATQSERSRILQDRPTEPSHADQLQRAISKVADNLHQDRAAVARGEHIAVDFDAAEKRLESLKEQLSEEVKASAAAAQRDNRLLGTLEDIDL